MPVVAIVGQTNRTAMGGCYQQEVDLLSLFKDVASDYVQMVTVPEQLPNVLDRAIRIALAERAPTAIIIPADVQELEYAPPAHAFKMVPSSLGIDWPTAVARRRRADRTRRRGAQRRQQGRDPGRVRAPAAPATEVTEVADLLGAGVAKALLGKDVLSDELPYVTGLDRPAGHPAELRDDARLRHAADRRVELSRTPSSCRSSSRRGRCRSTSTPSMIGMRYPYEVNLVGDAAATLRALLPLLEPQGRTGRGGRRIETEGRALVGRRWTPRPMVRGRPGQPDAAVLRAVLALPDDAIVTADCGLGGQLVCPPTAVPRRDARIAVRERSPRMGPGVPYGIGAKFGCPERPVIVFAGDGAI